MTAPPGATWTGFALLVSVNAGAVGGGIATAIVLDAVLLTGLPAGSFADKVALLVSDELA